MNYGPTRTQQGAQTKVCDSNAPSFMEIVANGDLDELNRLLKHDAIYTKVLALGNRVLTLAATNGHLPVVKRLLEMKGIKKEGLLSILEYALLGGHLPVVNYLLELKEFRDDLYTNYKTYLENLLQTRHYHIITRLLHDKLIIMMNSARKHRAKYGTEYPEVFRQVQEEGFKRTVIFSATSSQGLSKSKNTLMRLPAEIRDKILNLAFHNDMCGQSVCDAKNTDMPCQILNQFKKRNAVEIKKQITEALRGAEEYEAAYWDHEQLTKNAAAANNAGDVVLKKRKT